ncbi:MAG: hypothetical protein RQ966_12910 [Acetobacteraceae bacterium]|nr:hypothetical protein [Acetobacteraceae bacterium]
MGSGAILLGQVAERTAILDVACTRCERRGRLRVAGLLAQHGPEKPMTLLLDELAADCPRSGSTDIYNQCGAHFPDLPRLFPRAEPP